MRTLLTPYGQAHVVETASDAIEARNWICDQPHIALDTETTGLDIFSETHHVRLVQFGDERTAYLFPAQQFKSMVSEIIDGLVGYNRTIIMHNAPYDLMVLAIGGFIDIDSVYPAVEDTRILAHLVDPRGKQDGGVGHSLKGLSAVYVDENAPDDQTALKDLFKANGWDWTTVPLTDPTYLMYSGVDVQLTTRLYHVLDKMTQGQQQLRKFELAVQQVGVEMQMRGVKIDVEYAATLTPHFDALRDEGAATAAAWGIEKVGSPAQVAAVLTALGVELLETTKSGAAKVDKQVLADIIGNADVNAPAAEVASAVLQAKRAGKNKVTYVDNVIASLDANNRVHPWIHTLQARTARMSISGPPLQQLPSGDHHVRRMFVPDDGMVMGATDYAQVELRVLAVLADERKMIDAINDGKDLHDVTAANLFGPDFTKQQRKLAKNVGFGRVYGGGATTLARQAAVSLEDARRAMSGYDTAFPGIKRYSNKLQSRAKNGVPEVITAAGRTLPLDRWRLYAATNYAVQSTARDVLANALVELKAAGLGDHLLLPIHDEVLWQAPAADAAEVGREIQRVMTVTFGDVTLDAETDMFGPSWGHGYGATS